MPFGHQKKLRAGKESEVLGDLRLIQSQHIGAIIKLRLDAIEAPGLYAPGLLARHMVSQPVARAVCDVETKNVLRVVFDSVPAGRPDGQREVQARRFDVLNIRRDVKEPGFDARNLNRVIDTKVIGLTLRAGR